MVSKNNYARPGSKWTALAPLGHEKHFELVGSELGASVLRCVVTSRLHSIPYADLKDKKQWLRGWL